jgi:hypothetical protein
MSRCHDVVNSRSKYPEVLHDDRTMTKKEEEWLAECKNKKFEEDGRHYIASNANKVKLKMQNQDVQELDIQTDKEKFGDIWKE